MRTIWMFLRAWGGTILLLLVFVFVVTMCSYAHITDDTPSPRERCQARHGQVVENQWEQFEHCILPAP